MHHSQPSTALSRPTGGSPSGAPVTVEREIVDVVDYGAGDLIDVRIEGRRDTVLIPFADQYVLAAEEDRIVVDLPEGFLEVEEKR